MVWSHSRRFDTSAEQEIADLFIKRVGGQFQKLSADPYANHDRLWFGLVGKKKDYRFVECRDRRGYSWSQLQPFGVRVNFCKLSNTFIFVVRDALKEVRIANIGPERLLWLRHQKTSLMADQGGKKQKGVDIPVSWFHKIS